MAIDVYNGDYVTAESAFDYIDFATIEAACKDIKEAVEQLQRVGLKVAESKDFCTKDHLSIDGMIMEDEIDECVSDYSDTAEYMNVFADAMLGALQKAVDIKQKSLNAIAQSRETEIIKQINERKRTYSIN